MNKFPRPSNEQQRLEALDNYAILDSHREKAFDRITQLASLICDVPISTVSLIDEKRQWFKSVVGLDVQETSRDLAFCQYAIMDTTIYEVEDATKNYIFSDNELVTGNPHIRFYAGYPLVDPEGFALGTLCVIDTKPKKLNEKEKKALQLLGQEVMALIVERRQKQELKNFGKLFQFSNDLMFIGGLDGFFKKINPAFEKVLGWDKEHMLRTSSFEFIHPDDIEDTEKELKKLSQGLDSVNFVQRFKASSGEYKTIQWTASPEQSTGNIFGIGRDISELRLKEQQLLISETRFRSFFENAQSLMFMHDLKGNILSFNKAGASSLGYTIEEISVLSLFDIIPGVNHSILKTYLQQINSKKISKGQMITCHKNGSMRIWMYTNSLQNNTTGEEYVIGNAIDITDRYYLQKDLERTRKMLEKTNAIARVGGWDYDVVNKKINWSAVTKEIHEVPADYIPDVEKGIGFYKEGESRTKILELFNRSLSKGESYDVDLQIITAKGKEIWVKSKGEVEIKNGKCIRLHGTFQDINNEKLKDIQLARSEEQFRQTFNSATIGMALVALDGKWMEVNKSLCTIIGYKKDELLKISFQDITHPDDLEKDLQLLNELLTDNIQNYQMEKRYFHKLGHIVWAVLSVSLVRDQWNNPVHFVSQIMDITATKEAEKILKEERTILKTVIDNIPVNVFIKDLQSRKTLVNRKEMEYMNVANEAELLGKNDFDLYPQDSASISVQEDREVFETGQAFLNKETCNTKKDGNKIWFLTSKIPLKNEQDEIIGLLGISYDINERKEHEKKLKQLVDVTAEQNMRLTNFAHIVSHNLSSHANNFATLISFMSMETELVPKDELFTHLKKASVNLTETVNDLNEIVAINTSIHQNIILLNLHSEIVKVQDNIKALLIQHEVECINEVDKWLNIPAVPAYLDSILLNLFTNSIKYKSPDKKPVIHINSSSENGFTILSFKDNGIGIDLLKNGHKIFGLYKTFNGNKDARGVGLFITKSQVESIGGKIELASSPGEGTTFKIYFPEKITASPAQE